MAPEVAAPRDGAGMFGLAGNAVIRAPLAGGAARAAAPPAPDPTPGSSGVVPLRVKVGQMLMLGLPGTNVDGTTESLIRGRHIGNIVYLAGNVASPPQARALSLALQRLGKRANGLPMLIAIDQEGTPSVLRLTAANGFTTLNYNWSIGCLARSDRAKAARLATAEARAIAQEMLAAGINTDFAPVSDVWLEPANTVVGTSHRTFGRDPAIVARLVSAFIRGLHAGDVLSTVKHFPGHGGTVGDSHQVLPTDYHSAATIKSAELRPFRAAIDAGTDLVMSAHVVYPALDPAKDANGFGTPATLSQPILSGILRGRLQFPGVIISDDFDMGALTTTQDDLAAAAIRAVQAGVNIILTLDSDRAAAIYDAILARAQHDAAFRAQVNGAYDHIALLKQSVRITGPLAVVRSRIHLSLASRLAALPTCD